MPYMVKHSATLEGESIAFRGPRKGPEALTFMLNRYEQEGWRLINVGESNVLKMTLLFFHKEQ
jgi:hypothetical protein